MRRDELNDHVLRMEPDNIIRTVTNNSPVGRRTSSTPQSGNNRPVTYVTRQE
jgi:hypothetical protein